MSLQKIYIIKDLALFKVESEYHFFHFRVCECKTKSTQNISINSYLRIAHYYLLCYIIMV